MNTLIHRHILLVITGSIAAYKGLEVLRLLKQAGAKLKVVMTDAAQQFITPLAVQALLGEAPYTNEFSPQCQDGMDHIALARWADLILIAPATAHALAGIAIGRADDLLGSLCLATRARMMLVPAMNQAMWSHPATQSHVETLRERGAVFCGPECGEQACGDNGFGRMSEPADVLYRTIQCFESGVLSGRRIVITAGPTLEPLDPVRYLSNHSSGKMGYALARVAQSFGAEVTLISGPVHLPIPDRVHFKAVTSAKEMFDAALLSASDCDIFIGAAAVCDYTPREWSARKIKKQKAALTIECVPTPDIITAVARLKPKPTCIGFAAQTHDLIENAQQKLQKKKLDMIVANLISEANPVFGSDDNEVSLITRNSVFHCAKASKHTIAEEILTAIASHLTKKESANV